MIKGLSKAVSQTARVKAAKNVLDSPKRGFKFTVEGRVADAAPATAASSREYPVVDHDYDACVVGAGGAGLRAAFGLVQEGFKTAVITKVCHREYINRLVALTTYEIVMVSGLINSLLI